MVDTRTSIETVRNVTFKLLAYCQSNNWSGYDPYDALNSKIFEVLPVLDFRFFRIGVTQLLKRSPVNIRPLLLIPKTQNPKAIALFLMAFLKLERLGLLEDKDLIPLMVDRLIGLRSPVDSSDPIGRTNSGNRYWSWGYSFPWQGRFILVPRAAANLVCTTFVANALLDAYERFKESRLLVMAMSSAEYILNELYWEGGDSAAGFSYPLPGLESRTHNANFLGAAMLCRAYKFSGENAFLEAALKAARYSAAEQRADGSWEYAESARYRWIDNFHTGYNLCALLGISKYGETTEFDAHMRRGFEFYRNNFFAEDGAPKYFHSQRYPLDIHCVAQSIITLLEFKELDESNVSLAHAVINWAMANLWDEGGYFHYQIQPHYKNKIPYMRWSQAWMLYALSKLLEYCA